MQLGMEDWDTGVRWSVTTGSVWSPNSPLRELDGTSLLSYLQKQIPVKSGVKLIFLSCFIFALLWNVLYHRRFSIAIKTTLINTCTILSINYYHKQQQQQIKLLIHVPTWALRLTGSLSASLRARRASLSESKFCTTLLKRADCGSVHPILGKKNIIHKNIIHKISGKEETKTA